MTPVVEAKVVGLPVRDDEQYVTVEQLGRQMGVSKSTIYRWMREGMPSETWGIRARRFLPSRCMAWRRTHLGGRA